MDDGVSLRPPPVCTGRGGRWLRKEWEPPTLLAALCELYALWRLPDGLPPLRRCANASAQLRCRCVVERIPLASRPFTVVGAEGSEVSSRLVQKIAELASKSWLFSRLRFLIRPRGLCGLLRCLRAVQATAPPSSSRWPVLWSSKLREEGLQYAFCSQKSISSLINALAGCERHCAVLLASEHQSICSPHTAILNESALGTQKSRF